MFPTISYLNCFEKNICKYISGNFMMPAPSVIKKVIFAWLNWLEKGHFWSKIIGSKIGILIGLKMCILSGSKNGILIGSKIGILIDPKIGILIGTEIGAETGFSIGSKITILICSLWSKIVLLPRKWPRKLLLGSKITALHFLLIPRNIFENGILWYLSKKYFEPIRPNWWHKLGHFEKQKKAKTDKITLLTSFFSFCRNRLKVRSVLSLRSHRVSRLRWINAVFAKKIQNFDQKFWNYLIIFLENTQPLSISQSETENFS